MRIGQVLSIQRAEKELSKRKVREMWLKKKL